MRLSAGNDVVGVHRSILVLRVKAANKEFVLLVRVEFNCDTAAASCCADELPVVCALFACHYFVTNGGGNAAPDEVVVSVALGVYTEVRLNSVQRNNICDVVLGVGAPFLVGKLRENDYACFFAALEALYGHGCAVCI